MLDLNGSFQSFVNSFFDLLNTLLSGIFGFLAGFFDTITGSLGG